MSQLASLAPYAVVLAVSGALGLLVAGDLDPTGERVDRHGAILGMPIAAILALAVYLL